MCVDGDVKPYSLTHTPTHSPHNHAVVVMRQLRQCHSQRRPIALQYNQSVQ